MNGIGLKQWRRRAATKTAAKAVAEKVVVLESSDGFSLLNFQD